ncbi:MAG: cytochrome c [Planctomycetes bacterium]|nr:cytochrome c [Planctomycetota bacterium]
MPFYPVQEYGPLMKGMLIGGLGIVHVFTAQFAIGGGLLMIYFQWLAKTGREPLARRFLEGFFKSIVLLSFVFGALTGVAMWFTSIQVGARTIGVMIDAFHWLWATEWLFFAVEVIAGYAFYRTMHRLSDGARMTLLIAYAVAAWMSLFWINGILSFQLTPGSWPEDASVFSGFFNASMWPALFFRTLTSMATAALVACVVINLIPDLSREEKRRLIHRTAHFLAPMLLMPLFGAWFLGVMPPDSRSWILGGSTVMTLFLGIAIGSSLLIGSYAALGLFKGKLTINTATAALLCALGLGATAGAEFVREGARKPFTIRKALYSNSIAPDEVIALRGSGAVANDPWPLRDAASYPNDQVRHGRKVYRALCSVCHTEAGANGLTHLAGTWSPDQRRMNFAKLQMTKPFMPPFAGNAEDVEALAQYVAWLSANRPKKWPVRQNPEELRRIQGWLDEAGVLPATDEQRIAAGRN